MSTKAVDGAVRPSRLLDVSEALKEIEDEQPLIPADGEQARQADRAHAEDSDHVGEPKLDPEVAAKRSAALAHVKKYGDPVLKIKARPVDHFDEALVSEIGRMGALMKDALGIGLAATQLGVLHRVLVYRVAPQAPVAALINPVLEWKGSEQEIAEEGCLSLPAVHVDVERPVHVRVRAQDEHGAPIVVEASGLEARVIQHEIDHLDGILILDRTSREERKLAIRALREAQHGA